MRSFGLVRKALVLVFLLGCMALPLYAADTIKIGEIATVTGDFAAYGVAEVESVKIAVDEINKAGGILGKQVEVIMYDCRTRQEDMVNAARRLVEQDKVCAVIGPSGSGLCIAAAPVFAKGKVPHIGTLPTNPLVTVDEKGKVRPYKLTDGGGLYVQVMPSGIKTWRFRYVLGGAAGDVRIGRYPEIGVADARDRHFELRQLV